jgi:hypothetical protein
MHHNAANTRISNRFLFVRFASITGVILLLAVGSATASDVAFGFAAGMGGTSTDRGHAVAVDASGNVYCTGFFRDTADFDPGAGTANLTTAGLEDIFVCKLDSNGDFVWAAAMGGTSVDLPQAIAVDGSGNVYTTGGFIGTADFDPGAGTANLTAAGLFDIFVSKLDSDGNFVWAKRMGATNSNVGWSIAVDSSGNVYTTGQFNDTADFNPGAGTANLTSAGALDIFVQKLDSDGNFVWAGAIGGTAGDIGQSIAVDATGNVYTTGLFSGTADFNPGGGTANLTAVGDTDIFVSKLSSAGGFVWAKAIGGTGSDEGRGIAVDASANAYTTGSFASTVDFDPGAGTANLTSAGSVDIFVHKLNSAGNFVWAKAMGGTTEDEGFAIALDGSGDVYTTGDFEGTVDFDPGAATRNLTPDGVAGVFVQKLDAAGNFMWAKQTGGSTLSVDDFMGIAVDGSGSVVTAGLFAGTDDFDPGPGTANLTSAGGHDAYVSKLVVSDTTWVDFAFTGSESGSELNPFNTLGEGLSDALEPGTVKIKGDSGDTVSNETLTIDQTVTLEAINGTVRIGDAGGRSEARGNKPGFVAASPR